MLVDCVVEVVEQGKGGVASATMVKVARVVLNAVRVTRRFNEFQVVVGALLESGSFNIFAFRFKYGQTFCELATNSFKSIGLLTQGCDEVLGWEDVN